MLRALVLGAVQGLTEFVPVSSSGHLVVVPFLLGWQIPELGFDVAVHLGTALAILVYFRREILGILAGTLRTIAGRGREPDRAHARMAGLLILGSIPAAGAGLLLEPVIEDLVSEPPAVAGFLGVTAILLFLGERIYARRPPAQARDISRVGWRDAVAIGMLQAVAIAPGISRSGATISAGLTTGLTRDAAARFSFLLGLPAILGAGLLKAGDLADGVDAATVAGATAVSAVTGFAAIALLLRYLRVRDTRPFAWYCLLIAAVTFGYWLQIS